MTFHQAGLDAGGRHQGRRPPAGHYPINTLFPHVLVAGSSMFCAGCGTTGTAPLPREATYNLAVETFLRQHKRCGMGQAA